MPNLIDVTLREAGIDNGFSFTLDQVGAIVRALDDSGIDVIEIGYFRPRHANATGACCGQKYLETVFRNRSRSRVAVMVHIDDVPPSSYRALAEWGVSMVRLALCPADMPHLPAHVEAIRSAGMSLSLNVTRASELTFQSVRKLGGVAQSLGADCFYIADSNGSFYPETVRAMANLLRGETSIPLGFHAHDNLRLAFANTLVCLNSGFEWLDASLGGAGKGGGNLVMELVASHFVIHGWRDFDLFRLSEAYSAHVAPAVRREPGFNLCNGLFGLLDFNLERIAEVKTRSERQRIPVEKALAVHCAPFSATARVPRDACKKGRLWMTDFLETISHDTRAFLDDLDAMIASRKKMTSPLYQKVLAGEAGRTLLQNFVIHRYPIKNFWTRNILGIASQIDAYPLRRELVENIHEEETGGATGSKRHLDTFVEFGMALGLRREDIENPVTILPETRAVIEHNVRVCNSRESHFTLGVASVLLLMEGQPPIVSKGGSAMLTVMRDVYRLPPSAYEYFVHHASTTEGDSVSEIEEVHANTARSLLAIYCVGDSMRAAAKAELARAIELRHQHFDAILRHDDPSQAPFRYRESVFG